MVFEVIGFLALCAANFYFSVVVAIYFLHGGGDLGPLLTGWVHWKWKVWGIIVAVVNGYFWYLLWLYSPFTLSVNVN